MRRVPWAVLGEAWILSALGQRHRTLWRRPHPIRARHGRSRGFFPRRNPDPIAQKPGREGVCGPEFPRPAYQRIALDALYPLIRAPPNLAEFWRPKRCLSRFCRLSRLFRLMLGTRMFLGEDDTHSDKPRAFVGFAEMAKTRALP